MLGASIYKARKRRKIPYSKSRSGAAAWRRQRRAERITARLRARATMMRAGGARRKMLAIGFRASRNSRARRRYRAFS